MPLIRLRPQLAEHTDGWSVYNSDQWTVEYAEAGRVARVDVDRGGRTVVDFGSLRWAPAVDAAEGADAGAETPLTAAERDVVRPRILEAMELLGMPVTLRT